MLKCLHLSETTRTIYEKYRGYEEVRVVSHYKWRRFSIRQYTIYGLHKWSEEFTKIWQVFMIMNAWNITYSKKSDFIPLIGHGDPVPHISRSMEFTNDLWNSQSKNQDTLGQNMCESKKSNGKRTILCSSTPKYMEICEIHKFDLWGSQNFSPDRSHQWVQQPRAICVLCSQ